MRRPSLEGALALDEDTVWVRNAEDFLIEVDRATGERRRTDHGRGPHQQRGHTGARR